MDRTFSLQKAALESAIKNIPSRPLAMCTKRHPKIINASFNRYFHFMQTLDHMFARGGHRPSRNMQCRGRPVPVRVDRLHGGGR